MGRKRSYAPTTLPWSSCLETTRKVRILPPTELDCEPMLPQFYVDKQVCFEFPTYTPNKDEKIDYDQFEASYKDLKVDELLQ